MKRNYSQSLIDVVNFSREEVFRLGNEVVGPEHLFLGILRCPECEAYAKLNDLNINLPLLKIRIEDSVKNEQKSLGITDVAEIPLGKAGERIEKFMYSEAISLGNEEINTNHLLLAILKVPSRFLQLLDEFNIEYDMVRMTMEIDSFQNNANQGNENEEDDDDTDFDLETMYDEDDFDYGIKQKKGREKSDTPVLDTFGFDLTAAAGEGKIDPIYGRESEIERIVQILSRRKKNNPILIGEPGVGKTAIIEGLAAKMIKKDVPLVLLDKRLVSLDLASIVAGTKYRGQFEARMKNLIDELVHSRNVILFIDEIHTMIGAGDSQGAMDAANLLKPALARGELQCIGATTLDEYRKKIESDGALERRFQKVVIDPPSPEDTVKIIEKIKDKYEDHHHVKYTQKAVEACVKLTNRYVSDRALPDKAIDALDEAGARVHTYKLSVPDSVSSIETELQKTKDLKLSAVKDQQFEAAAAYRDKERDLEVSLDRAKKQWYRDIGEKPQVIDEDAVAEVVAMISGVPVKRIAQTEGAKLMEMKAELSAKIIGQDNAIEKIVKAIQRNRAGLKDPNKPIGSFIFLGPTGVGKTQLAKILSKYLFDTDDTLIRIDMSEYMEKFSVSRLVGAPPGYVGYQEGGQLTEKVRRKPYSVILLDEIEKAHPDVFNILLQILDEGRLTDSLGRRVDFRNTILIMTSNIGSRQLSEFGTGVGFDTKARVDATEANSKSIIENALKKTFAPEFLNRIDDVILFKSLTKQDIYKVIDIELSNLYDRINGLGFVLKLSLAAKNYVAEKGYDPKFGARPLKRAIQKYIEDAISEYIIRADVSEGDCINIGYSEKSGISIRIVKKKAKSN